MSIAMNLIGPFFLIFLTGFIICCSAIYGVSYDYNKSIEFVGLKTYDWMPVPEKADINNLDAVRIKKAVNTELEAKGLTKASADPDFLIAEHIKTKDKINIISWGYDCGPRTRYWGPCRGPGGVYVSQYEEGTIILDFVDPETMSVIWHGAAKSVVDDTMKMEQREKLIKEAVQKILRNFPPPEPE